jgi:hypothetical protein
MLSHSAVIAWRSGDGAVRGRTINACPLLTDGMRGGPCTMPLTGCCAPSNLSIVPSESRVGEPTEFLTVFGGTHTLPAKISLSGSPIYFFAHVYSKILPR